MKELIEIDGWTIGIWDEKNYFVGRIELTTNKDGEEVKKVRDAKYFTSIAGCCRRVSELVAVDKCTDLKSYVDRFTSVAQRLLDAFGEG